MIVSAQPWQGFDSPDSWLEAIDDPDSGAGSGADWNMNYYSREYVVGDAPYGLPYSLRGLRQIDTGNVCAGCDANGLEEGDVAIVNPGLANGHPYLECGDKVLVEGNGVYEVRDYGKFTDDNYNYTYRQLDHYSGVGGCMGSSACTEIGPDVFTIQLSDDDAN